MSLEQIGYGAGGGILSGILGAVLVALGLKERIKCLEEQKLSKDVFLEYRFGVETALHELKESVKGMDLKLDLLLKK
jgi:hypothetical protein